MDRKSGILLPLFLYSAAMFFLYDYIIGTSKDLYKKANDWKGRLNSIKTSVDGDINVKIRQLKIAEQAERFENANLKG